MSMPCVGSREPRQCPTISITSGAKSALSAKTIENGCTEQEAIAAMEMCGKLLAQHNLEMSETDIREQGCKEDYLRVNSKNINNNIAMLLSGIAMFVDAKPWIKNFTMTRWLYYKAYTLFGQEADIEMGSYLLFICTTAMLNDAHKYVRSLGVQQGGARTPLIVSSMVLHCVFIGV
jgi:hypothetical protein